MPNHTTRFGRAEYGQVKIDVRLEYETVWLTQKLVADLFQTSKQNISLHIKKNLREGWAGAGRAIEERIV